MAVCWFSSRKSVASCYWRWKFNCNQCPHNKVRFWNVSVRFRKVSVSEGLKCPSTWNRFAGNFSEVSLKPFWNLQLRKFFLNLENVSICTLQVLRTLFVSEFLKVIKWFQRNLSDGCVDRFKRKFEEQFACDYVPNPPCQQDGAVITSSSIWRICTYKWRTKDGKMTFRIRVPRRTITMADIGKEDDVSLKRWLYDIRSNFVRCWQHPVFEN